VTAEALLRALADRQLTLSVAEGDTGGLLLERLTAIPGSSATLLGGVVAYHDSLKLALLGVDPDLITAHGSVSQEVAEAMARGVRERTRAALGVAATGIAGPGGATPTKPVGLAYIAVTDGRRTLSERHTWRGTRSENRAQSGAAAIALVQRFLEH
jgi:PncC family amidohydrolase